MLCERPRLVFLILQGKQYAISEPYIATREDVFETFRILKVLKQIVAECIAQDEQRTE